MKALNPIPFALLLLACASTATAQKFENLAQTPPMGWNSWNCLECDGINEEAIKEIADAMVETGMLAAGYEYLVIDDCWQIDRDPDGNIVVDPEKFPSGMKALGEYIHSKGLKFGIYSDAGTGTCQGRPGSRGYEFQDARTYAAWGVDYLKYDWCNTGTQNAEASYTIMRDALYAAGRPIVLSICEWGKSEPWTWAQNVGHLWRTTTDIQDCWDCEINWGGLGFTRILDMQDGLEEFAGPGHWNDPDMLEVGNEGLTHEESKSHFSLWCLLAAPLMAGNDLREMDEATASILLNQDAIAVNQDPLGRQGFRVMSFNGVDLWVKPLEGGDYAICFFNRNDTPYALDFDWDRHWIVDKPMDWQGVLLFEPFQITDLWTGASLGTTDRDNPLQAEIPAHGVLFLRLDKAAAES